MLFRSPESYYPRLDVYPLTGPFIVVAGVNDQLRLVQQVGDVSTEFLIHFPSGALDADQAETWINGGLTLSAFKAETYHAPVRYQGAAVYEGGKYKSPPPCSFPTYNGTSIIQVGDIVTCLQSENGNEGKTGAVTDVTVVGEVTVQFGVTGVWNDGLKDVIEVTSPSKYLRIVPKDKRISLEQKHSISHLVQTDIQQATGNLFGFAPHERQEAFVAKAKDIASTLKNFLPANIETFFDPVTPVRVFRNHYSFNRVSLRQLGATCNIPASPAGVVEVEADQDMTGYKNAYMRILGVDTGVIGKIISVSPIRVDFSVPLLGGTNIPVEVIHDLQGQINSVRFNFEPYTGEYELEPGDTVFDWGITGFPWEPSEGVDAEVGVTKVILTSKDLSPNSFLAVENPELTDGLEQGHGLARFLQLPAVTKIREGSQIVLETTSGDIFRTVVSVKGSIAELNEPVEFLPVWDFSAKNKPRARVVDVVKNELKLFLGNLTTWLTSAGNARESDLLSLVEEIQVTKDISLGQIKSAQLRFMVWQNVFLGLKSTLENYHAPENVSVDSLLSVLKQEGLDRAFDFLVWCKFTDFFSLGQNTGSYAGMVHSCIREVAQKDIPRITEKQVYLQASIPTPDYEYVDDDEIS